MRNPVMYQQLLKQRLSGDTFGLPTQRKNRMVTRLKGRSDCRNVSSAALVTWSLRARIEERFLKIPIVYNAVERVFSQRGRTPLIYTQISVYHHAPMLARSISRWH
jgi:hypothetical protein